MTIGTRRRARHAARHRLPVNTLHKLCALRLVTLAASRSDIHFCNRRLRVGRRKNVVTVMAVSADGSACIALRDRFRMHALSIRKKRAVADAAALHDLFVAVTTTTRFGDVAAIDRRRRIGGRQHSRHVAVFGMAIDTGCGLASTLNGLGVKTTIVFCMRVGVKLGAAKIRQRLAGRMTTLAFERWIVLS